jgi:hypothetical protein
MKNVIITGIYKGYKYEVYRADYKGCYGGMIHGLPSLDFGMVDDAKAMATILREEIDSLRRGSE